MHYGWRAFFISLHITTFAFIAVILSDYEFVNTELLRDVKDSKTLDALAVAAQIGRLDIVSLVLTFVGIIIAVAGIFGLLQVRQAAEEKATAAAGPVAEKVARQIAKEIAESEAAPEARRIATESLENLNIDWSKLASTYPRSNDQDSSDAFAQALNREDRENAG